MNAIPLTLKRANPRCPWQSDLSGQDPLFPLFGNWQVLDGGEVIPKTKIWPKLKIKKFAYALRTMPEQTSKLPSPLYERSFHRG